MRRILILGIAVLSVVSLALFNMSFLGNVSKEVGGKGELLWSAGVEPYIMLGKRFDIGLKTKFGTYIYTPDGVKSTIAFEPDLRFYIFGGLFTELGYLVPMNFGDKSLIYPVNTFDMSIGWNLFETFRPSLRFYLTFDWSRKLLKEWGFYVPFNMDLFSSNPICRTKGDVIITDRGRVGKGCGGLFGALSKGRVKLTYGFLKEMARNMKVDYLDGVVSMSGNKARGISITALKMCFAGNEIILKDGEDIMIGEESCDDDRWAEVIGLEVNNSYEYSPKSFDEKLSSSMREILKNFGENLRKQLVYRIRSENLAELSELLIITSGTRTYSDISLEDLKFKDPDKEGCKISNMGWNVSCGGRNIHTIPIVLKMNFRTEIEQNLKYSDNQKVRITLSDILKNAEEFRNMEVAILLKRPSGLRMSGNRLDSRNPVEITFDEKSLRRKQYDISIDRISLNPSSEGEFLVAYDEKSIPDKITLNLKVYPSSIERILALNGVKVNERFCVFRDKEYPVRVSGRTPWGRKSYDAVLKYKDGSFIIVLNDGGVIYKVDSRYLRDAGYISNIAKILSELKVTATDKSKVAIKTGFDKDFELKAESDGVSAEYRKGIWTIKGNLKKSGKKSLKIEYAKFSDCNLLPKDRDSLVSKGLSLRIIPNIKDLSIDVKVQAFADSRKAKAYIRGMDNYGNVLSKDDYRRLVISTRYGDFEFIKDSLVKSPGVPVIVLKSDVKGAEIDGIKVKNISNVSMVLYPSSLDERRSGFVKSGRTYKKAVAVMEPGVRESEIPIAILYSGPRGYYEGNLLSFFKDLKEKLGKNYMTTGNTVSWNLPDGRKFSISSIKSLDFENSSLVISPDLPDKVKIVYRGKELSLSLRKVVAEAELNVKRSYMKIDIFAKSRAQECSISARDPVFKNPIFELPMKKEILKYTFYSPVANSYIIDLNCIVAKPDSNTAVFTFGDVNNEIHLSRKVDSRDITLSKLIIDKEIANPGKVEAAIFPRVSPDGKYVAYILKDLEAKKSKMVVSTIDGKKIYEYNHNVANLVWHPIKDLLVFSGAVEKDYSLYVYDPATGKIKKLYRGKGSNISPNFDAYGKELVWVNGEEGVMIGEFEGGELSKIRVIGEGIMPAVSIDGKVVYSRGNEVHLWYEGKDKVIDNDGNAEVEFSWSPDGRWIVYYETTKKKNEYLLKAYDIEEKKEETLTDIARRSFGRVVWIGKDSFIAGVNGQPPLAIFSLANRGEMKEVDLDYTSNFEGLVVATMDLNFLEKNGSLRFVMGGFVALADVQKQTILSGRLGR